MHLPILKSCLSEFGAYLNLGYTCTWIWNIQRFLFIFHLTFVLEIRLFWQLYLIGYLTGYSSFKDWRYLFSKFNLLQTSIPDCLGLLFAFYGKVIDVIWLVLPAFVNCLEHSLRLITVLFSLNWFNGSIAFILWQVL